jgi:hypothetical protein
VFQLPGVVEGIIKYNRYRAGCISQRQIAFVQTFFFTFLGYDFFGKRLIPCLQQLLFCLICRLQERIGDAR